MAALLTHAATLRALSESLATLDPQASTAIKHHMRILAEADAALREAGIQMASLQTLLQARGMTTHIATALRNRIDILIDAPPNPQPICQTSGD